MTRQRAFLAILGAAAAVAALVAWPGSPEGSRTARRAPEIPAETAAPAKRRTAPRAVTRVAEMPRGAPVPREDLLDDPNRVPGPDLEIRGFVVRSGRPVEGALVRLCRAYPSGREPEPSPAPFAETKSLDDGSFVARAARRTSLAVECRHEGSAIRRLFLVMPLAGDPEPVRIELAAGHELAVRVVRPEGGAVEGATVRVRCAGGAGGIAAARWHGVGRAASQGTAPRAELDAKTDADGRAVFRGVEAGPLAIDVGGVSEHVVVPTGVEVVFVQERCGTVEGILRDAAGRAVADTPLRVETVGFRDRLGAADGRTDPEGRFRIEGVPPGWIVGAEALRRLPVRAPPLLLRPGATVEWDPVVRPSLAVRGRVVDEDGRPVAVARVMLTEYVETAGLPWSDVTWSDEDGRFELRAPEPGEYTVRAEAFGRQGTIKTEAPRESAEIVLRPCARVVGRIRGATDAGFKQRVVQLSAQGFERSVWADALGRFAFEHVPPLRGALVGPGNSAPFDVPAGAVVHLDLDPHDEPWGRLFGEIRDEQGRPVAGAVVTYPEYGFIDMKLIQPAWANTAATDDEGRYELAVAPGWARRSFRVAAARAGFAPFQSKHLKSQPGDAVRLDFLLSPAAPLHGRVVDASGGPVRHAYVEAQPVAHEGFWFPESTHTAHDGTFRFARLAAGRYRVSLSADDVEWRAVEADTGESEILITVPGGGEIRGIVVFDDDETPIGLVPIVATSPAGRFTASASDFGRFRISGLPPGRYDVGIEDHHAIRGVPVGADDLVLRLRR